jgi:hypothetical protein
MVNVTSLQKKIGNKLFDALGSDISVKRLVTSSPNKWGDINFTYGSAVNTVAVPYSLIFDRQEYNPFGELRVGEVDMAFKHDLVIGSGDLAVMRGVNYVIREVEEFPLKDSILVKIARLSKSL